MAKIEKKGRKKKGHFIASLAKKFTQTDANALTSGKFGPNGSLNAKLMLVYV